MASVNRMPKRHRAGKWLRIAARRRGRREIRDAARAPAQRGCGCGRRPCGRRRRCEGRARREGGGRGRSRRCVAEYASRILIHCPSDPVVGDRVPFHASRSAVRTARRPGSGGLVRSPRLGSSGSLPEGSAMRSTVSSAGGGRGPGGARPVPSESRRVQASGAGALSAPSALRRYPRRRSVATMRRAARSGARSVVSISMSGFAGGS